MLPKLPSWWRWPDLNRDKAKPKSKATGSRKGSSKTDPKSAKGPAKSAVKAPKPPDRGVRPAPIAPDTPPPESGLSLDRKLDLLGITLFFAGLGTLLGLLGKFLNPSVADQVPLLTTWLDWQQTLAGWGVVGVPLLLMGLGLWLVLRHFGDKLPQIPPERIVGAGALYFALLATLHFATPTVTAPDFSELFTFATAGEGGGWIGALLLWGLFKAVGMVGAGLVLMAVWIVGLTFVSGRTLSEVLLILLKLWDRVPRPPARPVTPPPVRQTAPGAPAASALGHAALRPNPPASAPAADPVLLGALPAAPPAAPAPSPEPQWVLPTVAEVLEQGREGDEDDELNRQRQKVIEDTLASFGVPVMVKGWNPGPTITQFCVEPGYIKQRSGSELKVKISKIAALADDLALALEARSIRIEAPVPGTNYVGIEVPNSAASLVSLRDVMEADQFAEMRGSLRLGLGQDVSGGAIAADLGKMPHMLIAGTTGSGKSVCVNAIIACLLIQNTPDQLKFVMIDPKRVELTGYNGIPHLFAPVVVELERVVATLQWVTREMDNRYHKFAKTGVRDIAGYNAKLAPSEKPMPFLVIIIDELADLMMMAPDETERTITRLAQLARATGIHLIIATQRPSVDVVTGLIKANFKARIAFAVASSVDSRVILDQPGAERLLGRGDMLFQAPDSPAPLRMQGVFLSEDEIQRVVSHWKQLRALDAASFPPLGADSGLDVAPNSAAPVSGGPQPVIPPKQAPLPPFSGIPDYDPLYDPNALSDPGAEDPLLNEAITAVREMKKASISSLQRRLRIGYTRAARLIDLLEEQGIVGPAKPGAQQREVIGYTDAPPDLAEESQTKK